MKFAEKMGLDPYNMELEDMPPLWSALSERDFETAGSLIEKGARLDDLIEENGGSFLHNAARRGDLPTVDFFLQHDCPKTLEQFYIQETPLICAANNGQTKVVARLLSARVNPNARDEQRVGNTAIREAVRGGHTEIVSLLLQAGADPTIEGWMAISAVDQAWYEVKGSQETVREIRALLKDYPSGLRDKQLRRRYR